MTLILAIESSCDETAVALVEDGLHTRAHALASQVELHAHFGGVIPEVASRSHLEALFPLLEQALDQAGVRLDGVDALAVTNTPGLVGCLLVGIGAAKGLALATGLPLVAVNHVQAHVYGALMQPVDEALPRGAAAFAEAPGQMGAGSPRQAAGESPKPPPVGASPRDGGDFRQGRPLASLVVSGGHTSLYASRSPIEHELLGASIDDAAGEAYDKVAALLGLSYPGGPAIDKLAREGNPAAFAFPRSRPGGHDFSFSGLKTAVLYASRGPNHGRAAPLLPDLCVADLAASFQAAVVDVLRDRLLECARQLDAGGLVVCGGVAANSALRQACARAAEREGLPLYLPTPELATDNAVMVAGLAFHLLAAGRTADLSLDAVPRGE